MRFRLRGKLVTGGDGGVAHSPGHGFGLEALDAGVRNHRARLTLRRSPDPLPTAPSSVSARTTTLPGPSILPLHAPSTRWPPPSSSSASRRSPGSRAGLPRRSGYTASVPCRRTHASRRCRRAPGDRDAARLERRATRPASPPRSTPPRGRWRSLWRRSCPWRPNAPTRKKPNRPGGKPPGPPHEVRR